MSKIEIARWSEQLRRMLGQKGQEFVAGELSPEVSATIQLEGPTIEWWFLKGVRAAGAGFQVTGGVGTENRVRMRNPLGSGAVAVLEIVEVYPVAASQIIGIVGSEVTDTGIVSSGTRDGRWGQAGAVGQNVIILSSTNTAGVVGNEVLFRADVLASSPFKYTAGVVILPGQNFDVGLLQFNVNFTCTLAWSERRLPQLEE